MIKQYKLSVNGNFCGYFESEEKCEEMVKLIGLNTTIIWCSIEEVERRIG